MDTVTLDGFGTWERKSLASFDDRYEATERAITEAVHHGDNTVCEGFRQIEPYTGFRAEVVVWPDISFAVVTIEGNRSEVEATTAPDALAKALA